MSAGAIPVFVVRDWVRPLEEKIDWPSFSFVFSPDDVGPGMVDALRAVGKNQLLEMQVRVLLSDFGHKRARLFGGHSLQFDCVLSPESFRPSFGDVVDSPVVVVVVVAGAAVVVVFTSATKMKYTTFRSPSPPLARSSKGVSGSLSERVAGPLRQKASAHSSHVSILSTMHVRFRLRLFVFFHRPTLPALSPDEHNQSWRTCLRFVYFPTPFACCLCPVLAVQMDPEKSRPSAFYFHRCLFAAQVARGLLGAVRWLDELLRDRRDHRQRDHLKGDVPLTTGGKDGARR